MSKIHFVYPLKKSSVGDCEEFKYSLRCLESNVKDDFDVTVIGYQPKWLDISKVNIIRYPQCAYASKNTLLAFEIAANMFNDFVFMHDDFFINQKVTLEDLKTVLYLQDFNDIKTFGSRIFQQLLKILFEEVKQKGLYGLNYATHSPYYMESKYVKEVIEEFNLWDKEKFASFEGYYYNYIRKEKEAVKMDKYKYGMYRQEVFDKNRADKSRFLNFDENGMVFGMFDYIKEKYNKKSIFEK